MRLVNPREPRESLEQKLENIFAAKYPWLLRWALHFTQNDRSTAEDLVQETLIRVLSIRDTLSDLDNIEPLLYTHLRFAYLTECRRVRSRVFQSLAVVDFDTLATSLHSFNSFDQIEIQNELRNILAFLLWRRRSAKFASIFLLRFFHELAPEAIAGICLISRRAVDLGSLHTRSELKAYLANPSQLQPLRHGPAPEYTQFNIAIPSYEFANEVLETIFKSTSGSCPPSAELERRYSTLNPRPLESDLVAHIVSCKTCLERVTKFCGAPPPSTRADGDSFGPVRRPMKSKRSELSEREIIARTFAHGKHRMREIFEHHPTGLVIALNAEVVAVRDISSPRAVLKVECHSIATLEMVEVFSEQGLLMLAFPVIQHPPQSPPELKNEIALSGERMLRLTVHFTGDGAWIEAIYLDPHFMANSHYIDEELSAGITAESESVADANGESIDFAAGNARQPRKQSWWSRIFSGNPLRFLRSRQLVPIAVSMLFVGAVLWITAHRKQQVVGVNELLNTAVRAETNLHTVYGAGVVHQRIQIRTAGKTKQRDLYRDIEGRRRPKTLSMDSDERLLRAKLIQAGLDWNDPLSAAAFQTWHDHVLRKADQIERTGDNLLNVTTTVIGGPVVRESLTVRLNDFHAVARTLIFENRETVEIAELSYEIQPWGPMNEGWFEPLSGSLSPSPLHPHLTTLPSAMSHLSAAELDIADLNVLLALQELHADTERLQVTRSASSIAVTGIVETDSRNVEITSRLRTIPHVTSDILSYRDFDAKPETNPGPTTIKVMSVVDGESPLDSYCRTQQISRESCQQLAYHLLNSSATLVRESSRLTELQRQYPSDGPMTPAARALLSELMRQHLQHLAAAVNAEKETYLMLGVNPASLKTGTTVDINLTAVVERNLHIADELVYARDEHSRDTSIIIQDLATSAGEVQAAISRIPFSSENSTNAAPSNSTTPHE